MSVDCSRLKGGPPPLTRDHALGAYAQSSYSIPSRSSTTFPPSSAPSRSRSNSFAVSEQSIPHSIQDVEKSYVSTLVSALLVTLNSKYHQSLLCIDFHDAIIFLIGLPKQFEGEVSPSENHIPERFQRRAKKSAQVVTCSHEPSQPRFFRRIASEYTFFINHFPCLLRSL